MYFGAEASPLAGLAHLLAIDTITGSGYVLVLEYNAATNNCILRGASHACNNSNYFVSGHAIRIIGSWVTAN